MKYKNSKKNWQCFESRKENVYDRIINSLYFST